MFVLVHETSANKRSVTKCTYDVKIFFAGDQLISTRMSDENFYSRRNDEHGEKIMKTVKDYSAARFICDNTKLKKVQKNIFLIPSKE
jgi:hypothetical protein